MGLTNLRRLSLILCLFFFTSCKELDESCTLLELVVPDEHYNITKEYQGQITDLHKWWGQFDHTPIAKLVELAVHHNPRLEKARNKIKEIAYKHEMKDKDVDLMMKNLDKHIQVSILSPDSKNLQNAELSVIHPLLGKIPKDFPQQNKTYFRILRSQIELDLFGKNKSWRESAIGEIKSTIEALYDLFSIVRFDIVKHFLHIRKSQIRLLHLAQFDKINNEMINKIKLRVRSGIGPPKDHDFAEMSRIHQKERGFHERSELKKGYYNLVKATGINDLEKLIHIVGRDDKFPEFDKTIFVGKPLDIIKQRSDIKSKLNLLRHACGMMGITLADSFPKLIIDSVLEASAKTIFDLLKVQNYNFAYGYHLDHNVFQREKVKAKVDEHKAKYKQTQSDYRKIVSDALADVAHAMLNKSSIEKKILLNHEKESILENRIQQNKARNWGRSNHYINTLEAKREKFLLDHEKIKLDYEELICTIELIRQLGG